MTKEIKTVITIHASPEKVWEILTHQSEYPHWNPFIKKLEGTLKVGEQLKITIQTKNASTITFKPTVIAYNKNKTLQWKGRFLFKGLFDGTHCFELIDHRNGTTTFKHSEIFTGLLVWFMNLDNTQKGFENMNSELKKRCESYHTTTIDTI